MNDEVPPAEPDTSSPPAEPGWSEATKAAVCFYCVVPFMLVGAVLAFKQDDPAPALGLPFLVVAFACSIGAIYFRHYRYDSSPTGALAVWCAPLLSGLFLVGAILGALGLLQ